MCESHASRLEQAIQYLTNESERVEMVQLSTEERGQATRLRLQAQLLRESFRLVA